METLKAGMVARFETVRNGFVPVRVLRIVGADGRASTAQTVVVRMTRTKAGYRAGETLESSAMHVIPPGALRRTRYATYIRQFHVVCDEYRAPGAFNLSW